MRNSISKHYFLFHSLNDLSAVVHILTLYHESLDNSVKLTSSVTISLLHIRKIKFIHRSADELMKRTFRAKVLRREHSVIYIANYIIPLRIE
jgi:hypothetical protein